MNSKQKLEEYEERMNLIGLNGNDGLHYSLEDKESEEATKPSYYHSREIKGLDVIDLIKEWELNFNEGNILKYLLRKKDSRVVDLQKIVDYSNREIEFLKTIK